MCTRHSAERGIDLESHPTLRPHPCPTHPHPPPLPTPPYPTPPLEMRSRRTKCRDMLTRSFWKIPCHLGWESNCSYLLPSIVSPLPRRTQSLQRAGTSAMPQPSGTPSKLSIRAFQCYCGETVGCARLSINVEGQLYFTTPRDSSSTSWDSPEPSSPRLTHSQLFFLLCVSLLCYRNLSDAFSNCSKH